MSDLYSAILEFVKKRTAAAEPPPHLDLTAPDIIIHLRVKLKVGSDEIQIIDDDIPDRLERLEKSAAFTAQKADHSEKRLNLIREQVSDLVERFARLRKGNQVK